MSWLELVCLLAVTSAAGCAVGSVFTQWAMLDMIMTIDDTRAEDWDRRL